MWIFKKKVQVIGATDRVWVKKMIGKETRDLESIALWIGSPCIFFTTISKFGHNNKKFNFCNLSAMKEKLCLLISSIFYMS